MYALLIVDGMGNVKCWQKGDRSALISEACKLPSNGWSFYAIQFIG